MPAAWAASQMDALRRYLASQFAGNWLPVHAQICTVVVQIGLCHLLVNVLDFGIIGAAIAANFSAVAGLITLESLIASSWGIPTVSFAKTTSEGMWRIFDLIFSNTVVECSRNYGS